MNRFTLTLTLAFVGFATAVTGLVLSVLFG
jgi:hypothetical protein